MPYTHRNSLKHVMAGRVINTCDASTRQPATRQPGEQGSQVLSLCPLHKYLSPGQPPAQLPHRLLLLCMVCCVWPLQLRCAECVILRAPAGPTPCKRISHQEFTCLKPPALHCTTVWGCTWSACFFRGRSPPRSWVKQRGRLPQHTVLTTFVLTAHANCLSNIARLVACSERIFDDQRAQCRVK